MALKAVNMENCDKKQRCLSGPNAGLAYTPGDECEQGFTFNSETCDCEFDPTEYIWMQVEQYLDCLGPAVPEGWVAKTSYLPQGPGCFKGSSLSLAKVQDTCLVDHSTTFENCETSVYPIIECKNSVYDYTLTVTPCEGDPYFVSNQIGVVCGSSPTTGGGDVVPADSGSCP